MTQRLTMVRWLGGALARVAAAVCLLAVPAHAAVLVDVSGDGIVDRVQLSSSSDGRVVVRVSGSVTQVLNVRGRLLSLVAVDIDHDGDLDLGALSERRGLLIWLNTGGHGRFTHLKKKHVARGRTVRTEVLLWVIEHDDDRPVAQDARPDASQAVRLVRGPATVVPPVRRFTFRGFRLRTARGRGAPSAPRAPPAIA